MFAQRLLLVLQGTKGAQTQKRWSSKGQRGYGKRWSGSSSTLASFFDEVCMVGWQSAWGLLRKEGHDLKWWLCFASGTPSRKPIKNTTASDGSGGGVSSSEVLVHNILCVLQSYYYYSTGWSNSSRHGMGQKNGKSHLALEQLCAGLLL